MIEKALRYVSQLKEESMDPKVIEINGKTYCNKNLTRYDEVEMASRIEASTLTVDYQNNCQEQRIIRGIV